MGKKMRKKASNPRKAVHREPLGSPRPVVDPKDEVEGEREGCNHYSKSVDELNTILSSIRLRSNNIIACEHCREEPTGKRGGKEKGKQHRKRGGGGARVYEVKKESNFIWVCLDCSRYFCGGEVSVSEPYGHARRHSKQEHHMWAVRLDDPLVSWCYSCSSSIPMEMPTEDVDVGPKAVVDSEDGVESTSSKGYVVRGLTNLGNTCFFNSVMQNLLATNMLRSYLVSLDRPTGSITMSLKKLFVDSSIIGDYKNVLSPKALFGSICAKAPQFRGYQQQDSHELLRYLLDGLSAEEINERKLQQPSDEKENDDQSPAVTFVDTIFGGQISSTVCCMECGHTSVVHEPFLDLSLPVPSKKPQPKKVIPPPPPKRSKPPLKERNKGRRFRERGVAKGSLGTGNSIEASSDALLECSGSVNPVEKQEESASTGVDDDFTWLDFVEAPVSQRFDSEQVLLSENTVDDTHIIVNENTTDDPGILQHENCSKDLKVSSDFSGETSCGNEVSSSCTKDSNVQLPSKKEPEQTVQEINNTNDLGSCSQAVENVGSVDAPADVEFDGFGDMFNEPEVTSVPKTNNETGEELNLTLWTCTNSESNNEEVDDSNAPVSVNSCLSLFTKPELLTDEQAWHCDRCSENVGLRKNKQRSVTAFDNGESRNEKPSANVQVEFSETRVSEDQKMPCFSENLSSQDDAYNDPSVEENTSQKPLNPFNGTYSREEIQNNGSSNFSGPDVLLKDEETAASDDSSLYFSCQSSHENNLTQERLFDQDADSCSFNDQDSARCEQSGGPVCGNDSTSEVNQRGKEGLLLLDGRLSLDGNGSEEVESETRKVKRDATKRILINKIPPILTIHLKRFNQDARGRLSKLRGHVSFQETLDLRPYMEPRSQEKDRCHYRLIGVVEHSGTMHGGHYVAYVRGERGRGRAQDSSGPAWFYISDAYVRDTSLSEVLKAEAYLLFYERV